MIDSCDRIAIREVVLEFPSVESALCSEKAATQP